MKRSKSMNLDTNHKHEMGIYSTQSAITNQLETKRLLNESILFYYSKHKINTYSTLSAITNQLETKTLLSE